MKTGTEIRLTSIENRLSAIETEISSLQPIPITSPYQEDELSPKTSTYQSPQPKDNPRKAGFLCSTLKFI